jgi:hypothetical protein
MPGDADPLLVLARRALLDGLEALQPHLDSVVVVGAQAVYLHTGPASLPVAEFTTDADIAIAPEFLAGEPRIHDLLEQAGFELQEDPGRWKTADGIHVDLLVPEAVAGPGRRGARLPGHGRRAARRVKGLEGALVDNEVRTITALNPTDTRSFEVKVAGPAALLVAKIHKVAERIDQPHRLVAKDALDVLRILQAVPTGVLAGGLGDLESRDVARRAVREAVEFLARDGGRADGSLARLVLTAVGPLGDPQTATASLAALTADLLTAFGH